MQNGTLLATLLLCCIYEMAIVGEDREKTSFRETEKLFNCSEKLTRYNAFQYPSTFLRRNAIAPRFLKETRVKCCTDGSMVLKDNRASGFKNAIVEAAESGALLRWNAVSAAIVSAKRAFFGLVARPLSRLLEPWFSPPWEWL